MSTEDVLFLAEGATGFQRTGDVRASYSTVQYSTAQRLMTQQGTHIIFFLRVQGTLPCHTQPSPAFVAYSRVHLLINPDRKADPETCPKHKVLIVALL